MALSVLPGYTTASHRCRPEHGLILWECPPPVYLSAQIPRSASGELVCASLLWSQSPAENASSQHGWAAAVSLEPCESTAWWEICSAAWTHVRALSFLTEVYHSDEGVIQALSMSGCVTQEAAQHTKLHKADEGYFPFPFLNWQYVYTNTCTPVMSLIILGKLHPVMHRKQYICSRGSAHFVMWGVDFKTFIG